MEIPEIPFKRWIYSAVDWISLNLEFVFEPIADVLDAMRLGLSVVGHFEICSPVQHYGASALAVPYSGHG